ncbi:MAG: hypothetical protein E7B40_10635 [Actinomyces sp.]|nr:hypothetical protein [Actinomyces sp.]
MSALLQWIAVLAAYGLLALCVLLPNTGVYSGTPVVIFGKPINVLWAIVCLCLCATAMSVCLMVRLIRNEHTTGNTSKRFLALLPLGPIIIYLFLALGFLIVMADYRYVPSSGESEECRVIYSIHSGATDNESGRFFISRSVWGIPTPTAYAWSRNGADSVPDREWEVAWKSGVGTLVTHGNIGIEPDTELPARFTCSH